MHLRRDARNANSKYEIRKEMHFTTPPRMQGKVKQAMMKTTKKRGKPKR